MAQAAPIASAPGQEPNQLIPGAENSAAVHWEPEILERRWLARMTETE